MRSVEVQVALTIGDLAGLPVGTRIVTNHNKVLELDMIEAADYPEPAPAATGFGPMDSDNRKEWRKDKAKWEADRQRGGRYWIEGGTLEPFYQPLVHWLPAFVLPPVVDHKADAT